MGRQRKGFNERVAWLAGLVDGEGTLGFYRAPTKGRKRVAYQKQLRVVVSDEAIILEVAKIFSEILGTEVPVNQWTHRWAKTHPHVDFEVSIRRHADIVKALYYITPYLVGKKAQAQLMQKLLQSHKIRTPYTEKEIAVIEAMKILKRKQMKRREEVEAEQVTRSQGEMPDSWLKGDE